MPTRVRLALALSVVVVAAAMPVPLQAARAAAPAGATRHAAEQAASAAIDLRGAWRAESYRMKDGTTHRVDGLIFFAERDWSVLYFVLDAAGQPRRGSGEAGGYTLDGDALVFTHRYNFVSGEAMAGLPAAPLGMTVRDTAGAPEEPCRVRLDGAVLTIAFPSGNSMTFRRSR